MHVCSLWEKKFGRQANHIKVREKEPRRIGREPPFKQPHTSDTGWSAHPPRAATPRSSVTSRSGEEKRAESAMHPSWIAKQKQKERAEAAAKGGATAKKIVFD